MAGRSTLAVVLALSVCLWLHAHYTGPCALLALPCSNLSNSDSSELTAAATAAAEYMNVQFGSCPKRSPVPLDSIAAASAAIHAHPSWACRTFAPIARLATGNWPGIKAAILSSGLTASENEADYWSRVAEVVGVAAGAAVAWSVAARSLWPAITSALVAVTDEALRSLSIVQSGSGVLSFVTWAFLFWYRGLCGDSGEGHGEPGPTSVPSNCILDSAGSANGGRSSSSRGGARRRLRSSAGDEDDSFHEAGQRRAAAALSELAASVAADGDEDSAVAIVHGMYAVRRLHVRLAEGIWATRAWNGLLAFAVCAAVVYVVDVAGAAGPAALTANASVLAALGLGLVAAAVASSDESVSLELLHCCLAAAGFLYTLPAGVVSSGYAGPAARAWSAYDLGAIVVVLCVSRWRGLRAAMDASSTGGSRSGSSGRINRLALDAPLLSVSFAAGVVLAAAAGWVSGEAFFPVADDEAASATGSAAASEAVTGWCGTYCCALWTGVKSLSWLAAVAALYALVLRDAAAWAWRLSGEVSALARTLAVALLLTVWSSFVLLALQPGSDVQYSFALAALVGGVAELAIRWLVWQRASDSALPAAVTAAALAWVLSHSTFLSSHFTQALASAGH